MLDDTDRLQGTVEQVLKAGEAGYRKRPDAKSEVDFGNSCTSAWRRPLPASSASLKHFTWEKAMERQCK